MLLALDMGEHVEALQAQKSGEETSEVLDGECYPGKALIQQALL